MEPDAERRAAALRRRRVIVAGHAGDVVRARRGLLDRDDTVRAAAVSALARMREVSAQEVAQFLVDPSIPVRRAGIEAALTVRGKGSRSLLYDSVIDSLGDPDPLVVVAAAWFLAERRVQRAVGALVQVASGHDDVRCREAAVAALGAVGDPLGLPAVLAALDDKVTIRRRATVALAGFDDPAVEPALHEAASDRDWQVRQAADELIEGAGD
jgi:HEAT repeat protein